MELKQSSDYSSSNSPLFMWALYAQTSLHSILNKVSSFGGKLWSFLWLWPASPVQNVWVSTPEIAHRHVLFLSHWHSCFMSRLLGWAVSLSLLGLSLLALNHYLMSKKDWGHSGIYYLRIAYLPLAVPRSSWVEETLTWNLDSTTWSLEYEKLHTPDTAALDWELRLENMYLLTHL